MLEVSLESEHLIFQNACIMSVQEWAKKSRKTCFCWFSYKQLQAKCIKFALCYKIGERKTWNCWQMAAESEHATRREQKKNLIQFIFARTQFKLFFFSIHIEVKLRQSSSLIWKSRGEKRHAELWILIRSITNVCFE